MKRWWNEGSYRTYEEWKHQVQNCLIMLSVSSYRTYEEWKPKEMLKSMTPEQSSYRTYEEWKPLTRQTISLGTNGSYRTYEEWKPGVDWARIHGSYKVLTVPMRNGNYRSHLHRIALFEFLPYL
mgnify:CR=1 FL=1